MAALDHRLVGITPAMSEGSGLVRFSQEYPDRYFDVGIAEQHAITFAAGLGLRWHETCSSDLFNLFATSLRSVDS